MTKFKLRFFFEHAGPCVWGANDAAQERFGYAIEVDTLPITEELKNTLANLIDEYATYLNWESPCRIALMVGGKKVKVYRRCTCGVRKP